MFGSRPRKKAVARRKKGKRGEGAKRSRKGDTYINIVFLVDGIEYEIFYGPTCADSKLESGVEDRGAEGV